jgi:hypothetical protein
VPQGQVSPDLYRTALDSVFATEPYRWAPPSALLRLATEWWSRLLAWIEALRTDNPLLFRIFFAVILLAWLGLVFHAAWLVWRTVRGAARAGRAPSPNLVGERHDPEWYSAEADRAAGEGRLRDALQLAFVATALGLDRQGLLRYHPGKTPAECAREARLAQNDRDRLRDLVRSLYAYAFGGRSMDAEDYRRWRATADGPWHAPAH